MRRKRGGKPKLNRNLEICKLADEGTLLREIGEVYNLSKSRVSHIITDYWKRYVEWKRKVGITNQEKVT